ncbi:MAG: FKBP-type peptidyl-prolyl cis-trans isomerase [Bacteroidota bacterium]
MHNLFLFILLFLFYSCGSENKNNVIKPINDEIVKERMVNVNKHLSRNENDEINAYIERRKWNVKNTNSGVRFWIYKEGNGASIKNNDRLKLKYKLSLINGENCYDSSNDGLLNLEIGKYEVSGLNEALQLMRKGDQAIVIVPSHLAYGLLGDQNRIPSKATLIYDLEILNQ